MILHCKQVSYSLLRSLAACNRQAALRRRPHEVLFVSVCDLSTTAANQDRKSLVTGGAEKQVSKDVKVTERIKQTTKDVTHISVILVGIGITCFVFYAVFKEFFSSKSPSSVFGSALKKCKQDPRVVELVGEPIKGHGEMTTRRRARHVSFVEYDNNGKTYLRVKFYLKGSKTTATVHCETAKDSPRSHFRYLFVETDSYPSKVIILEDNRLLEQDL